MALPSLPSMSSPTSYHGLSNSLNSFLSALQCHIDTIPSSPPLSQTKSQTQSHGDSAKETDPCNSSDDMQSTLKRLGVVSYNSNPSGQQTTEYESAFAYSSLLDALPESSNQYQQEQFQQCDDLFFDSEEWGTENIQFLLGITDGKDPSMEKTSTISESNPRSRSQSMSGTPVAEIKQPDAKEDFVHPGFYTISKVGQDNFSSPNFIPLKMARKRSLQEEGCLLADDLTNPFSYHGTKRADIRQSPQPNITEFRRFSLDSHLSNMRVTSRSPHLWGAYSTPPKSPSTPSVGSQCQSGKMVEPRQFNEAPLGQPYMTSFSPPNWMFGQEQVSPSLHQSRLARFQRTATPKQISSPLQPRKRRASKFKTDLLFPTIPGGLQYPLNTIPPPLQQQHHQPYLPLHYTAHHLQTLNSHQSSHPFLQTSTREAKTSFTRAQASRRNPGEVPSSTIPPDHFVFQEALLGMGYNPQTGKPHSQPMPNTDIIKELTSAIIDQLENPTPYYQDNGPVSSPHTLPSTPESQVLDHHLSSTTSTSMIPQSTEIPSHDEVIKLESCDEQALSAAAAFAQSLSTVSTLDPAATKLIDQLRLQEYLRAVETPSTSPSSILATSIINCNSSITCSSP